MWKKGDTPEYDSYPQREVPASADAAASAKRSEGHAVIGRSITIRGEVRGEEDLVIQGRVDGSVELDQHAVTVGPQGQVKANITARIVTVEGRVEGNVTGDEQVVLRKASSVLGDIKAPRVVLEDGAQFRGGVEMGEDVIRARRAEAGAAKPAPEPIKEHAHAQRPAAVSPASSGNGAGTAKTVAAKG